MEVELHKLLSNKATRIAICKDNLLLFARRYMKDSYFFPEIAPFQEDWCEADDD